MLESACHTFDSEVLPLLGKFYEDMERILDKLDPPARLEVLASLRRRVEEKWSKINVEAEIEQEMP